MANGAERTVIDEKLCRQVELLLKGGAKHAEAARITGTSKGTISRIKTAGFNLETFKKNAEQRRHEEAKKRMAVLEKKPEQMQVQLVYDESIAEEYRKEQAQKEEMSEQTKMMRFQAAQVEKLLQKMDKLNDTMFQIIRCITGE